MNNFFHYLSRVTWPLSPDMRICQRYNIHNKTTPGNTLRDGIELLKLFIMILIVFISITNKIHLKTLDDHTNTNNTNTPTKLKITQW